VFLKSNGRLRPEVWRKLLNSANQTIEGDRDVPGQTGVQARKLLRFDRSPGSSQILRKGFA
jgi:hypothetical protein